MGLWRWGCPLATAGLAVGEEEGAEQHSPEGGREREKEREEESREDGRRGKERKMGGGGRGGVKMEGGTEG